MIDRPRDEGEDGVIEQPVRRSLPEIIEACAIVEDELAHQIRRLEQYVIPRTEEESLYHADLKEGYRTSNRYVGILRKYQEGRLSRRERGDDMDTKGGINASGRATASVDE